VTTEIKAYGCQPDLHVFFEVLEPISDSFSVHMPAKYLSYRPISKEPADHSISACTCTVEASLLRLVDNFTDTGGGEFT
jgi:hypothetical protein